jgi:isopentenyl diphosphate isomerase/L-lactate dehydrogenase-like FMN-dependent dehydrogenase
MTGAAPGPVAEDAFTLHDFAHLARARLAPETWDFLEGGAGEERTLRANTEAYYRLWLHPGVLTGVGTPVTATRILGRTWAAPTAIAPMAHHTMAAPEGEVATARGAGAAGVPLVVSTFAGRTLEDIAAAATAPLWLQVYCFRDRATTRDLVVRAERAGFEALVLTVDAPRLGRRLRDLRNGFRLPAGIAPANLTGDGFGSPGDHALTEFDASLDWSVVTWLRSVSVLPVLVKGVLTAADARHAVEAGVDGTAVSNHGGRQLDGAPATLTVLPEVVAAVDRTCPVLVDGGVRRGTDVLTALALGADATLVGRPALHALAADPERGAARMRGTHSVPMRFTGAVPHNQVVVRHGDFRRVMVDVCTPLAHLGWSACWLGTAAGALSRTLRLLRSPEERRRRNLKSELLLTRLSRARQRIDTVQAMLSHVADVYVSLPEQERGGPSWQLLVNALKVTASEQRPAAVDELIGLIGLRHGYRRHQPLGLERALRDLRSASLNYGNDRLHLANGSLSLLDQETTLA